MKRRLRDWYQDHRVDANAFLFGLIVATVVAPVVLAAVKLGRLDILDATAPQPAVTAALVGAGLLAFAFGIAVGWMLRGWR